MVLFWGQLSFHVLVCFRFSFPVSRLFTIVPVPVKWSFVSQVVFGEEVVDIIECLRAGVSIIEAVGYCFWRVDSKNQIDPAVR